MSAAEGARDRFAAAGAWMFLSLVLLTFAAFLGVRAAVGFGVLGEGGHIVAARCVEHGGGKGGSYVECAGTFVNGRGERSDGPATVRSYSAVDGDVVPVRRAPWGTYEALDDSLLGLVGRGFFPLLLTVAAAGCLVRAGSFVRREAGEPAENRSR
ncbi:hypothetical protein [Streptomyces hazeniae]|nr:hypothetical protein [Streptomyces sp. DSM 42041]